MNLGQGFRNWAFQSLVLGFRVFGHALAFPQFCRAQIRAPSAPRFGLGTVQPGCWMHDLCSPPPWPRAMRPRLSPSSRSWKHQVDLVIAQDGARGWFSPTTWPRFVHRHQLHAIICASELQPCLTLPCNFCTPFSKTCLFTLNPLNYIYRSRVSRVAQNYARPYRILIQGCFAVSRERSQPASFCLSATFQHSERLAVFVLDFERAVFIAACRPTPCASCPDVAFRVALVVTARSARRLYRCVEHRRLPQYHALCARRTRSTSVSALWFLARWPKPTLTPDGISASPRRTT